MLFAGFDVFQGNLSMPGIIIAGVVGDVAGASIAYAIGYYGRRELLEHQGSKLHVSARGLDRAHRWFERCGAAGDLRLPPAPLHPRRLPVRGGRGGDVLLAVLAVGRARLARLDQRASASSAARSAATGRRGATTSSTSTTSAPWCWLRRSSICLFAGTAGGGTANSRGTHRRMSSPTEPGAGTGHGQDLAIGQAVLLGALHGPAELLPISSSGHVAVIPWLLSWDYERVDPRAAQGVRGGPARRHRGRPADHAAFRGGGGGAGDEPRASSS